MWFFFHIMKSGDRLEPDGTAMSKTRQEIADENAFYFLSDRVCPQLSAINTPGKTFHNQTVQNNQ